MKKYISIDLETTGLDWETCQILSFGAVIEDRENRLPIKDLPRFHRIIRRDKIVGEPFALHLNSDLIQIIKEGDHPDLINEYELIEHFWDFLHLNGFDQREESEIFSGQIKIIGEKMIATKNNQYSSIKINVVGKNFNGFDKRFLEKIPNFLETFKINRRVLDPAPLFLEPTDEWLPNLQTCMNRAGIESEVTHDAVQDAVDVIKVLRYKGI